MLQHREVETRLPSVKPIDDLVLEARRQTKAAIKQASTERRKALALRVKALDAAHEALLTACPARQPKYTG